MLKKHFSTKLLTFLLPPISALIMETSSSSQQQQQLEQNPAARKVYQKTVVISSPANGTPPAVVDSRQQFYGKEDKSAICLFLCGDVMTGRGVDQILPHKSQPHLYEPCVQDANGYVRLAERQNGPLPEKPVSFAYPWGDALTVLDEVRPHARIINLETSVTTAEDNWPNKHIHYRMHPGNVPCIASAQVDCCVLANNHVLDWGHNGLEETLDVLQRAGLRTTGAGRDIAEASAPAVIELSEGRRILVYGVADDSSGVPPSWAANESRAGVNFLPKGFSAKSAEQIGQRVKEDRRPSGNDVVIVSVHWGGNWGYQIPRAHREFAHRLIDIGSVDIVHGHSSHHPKGIEVYKGKLILYGCGDFLNDYEGISGNEEFRDDLTLMYFPVVGTEGNLAKLFAVPMQIRNMRLNRASKADAQWLHETMRRECAKLGLQVDRDEKTDFLHFRW